jgi:hypothetical protein
VSAFFLLIVSLLSPLYGSDVFGPVAPRERKTIDLGAVAASPGKLDSVLGAMMQEGPRRSSAGAMPQARDFGSVCTKDGMVLVEMYFDSGDAAERADATLAACGYDGLTERETVRVGWYPISHLPVLKEMSGLRQARSLPRPETNIGFATSQAEVAQRVNEVWQKYRVDGSGVKIGIVSPTFDISGTETAPSVLRGDLPGPGNPNGYTTPVDIVVEGEPSLWPPSSIDEGRAIAEVIHDLAPGAELAFAGPLGASSFLFADAIQQLADAGCDIIVDDVSLVPLIIPLYQEDAMAQKVEDLIAQGIHYFSSAGNSGRRGFYDTPYTAQPFLNAESFLTVDFDPDPEVFEPFLVASPSEGSSNPIYSVRGAIHWDEPWLTYSTEPNGASNRLTLLLLDENLNVLAVTSSQLGGDPILTFDFSLSAEVFPEVAIVVLKPLDGTADPSRITAFVQSDNADFGPVEFIGPTVYGHKNTENVISVGATSWFNTPLGAEFWNTEFAGMPPADGEGAVDTAPARETPILSFRGGPSVFQLELPDGPVALNTPSSVGGRPILFDRSGERLEAPVVRKQPAIVSADGVETSFFGLPNPDLSSDKRFFFGTSCAAPHAAAIGALLYQASGNSLTPEEMEAVLIATAQDMDDPFDSGLQEDPCDPLFARGFDFSSGHGMARALPAVERTIGLTGIHNLMIERLCESAEGRKWFIDNPNGFGLPTDLFVGGAGYRFWDEDEFRYGPAETVVPPGGTILYTEPGAFGTFVSAFWRFDPEIERKEFCPNLDLGIEERMASVREWRENFDILRPRFGFTYASHFGPWEPCAEAP